MSLFLRHTTIRKEGLRKVLDDKKCWGQRSRPALFFFRTKGEGRNSFISILRNKFAVQKQRISDGDMEKAHEGRQKTKEKGGTESKNKPYGFACKTVFLSPCHKWQGRERVNNGLPRQTVKGRGCDTEEGGCFGNAEAPDDDCCNPAHVWNFSFRVYP